MKKISGFLFTVIIITILSLFISCTAYADEYVEWTLSDDGQTLSDGTNTYEYYKIDSRYEHDFLCGKYIYENDVMYNGKIYDIRSTEKAGDIISLYAYSSPSRTYVTQNGKEYMDRLVSEENADYKIRTTHRTFGDFDKVVAEKLINDYRNMENPVNIDVTELSDWSSYKLTKHDEMLIFTYVSGAFFTSPEGEVYFIDFDSLGNQYFDADGNFSFRSGKVDMLKLDEETAKYIADAAADAWYYDYASTYEDSGLTYTEEEAADLAPLFYVGLVLLGFILPLPFLVMGIVFPRIKKFGKPKYWYILTIPSAIWIACATAFTIIMIVAM